MTILSTLSKTTFDEIQRDTTNNSQKYPTRNIYKIHYNASTVHFKNQTPVTTNKAGPISTSFGGKEYSFDHHVIILTP